jgi:peptidoglycan/LPS O-acetylase OafA/YrhL
VNTRRENALWTWPLLVIGLAALGVGAWVTAAGGKYIAPGVLVILCGIATVFMAAAGRRDEEVDR